MTGSFRTLACAAALFGLYAAFVCESVVRLPTILPQLPLLFAVWAICRCRPPLAIGISAVVGLGCDLLTVGPLGPAMLAATFVAVVAKALHVRVEPRSLAGLTLVTALAVTASLTLEASLSAGLLKVPLDLPSTLLMAGSRGATSAFIAVAAILAVRSLRLLQRVATTL